MDLQTRKLNLIAYLAQLQDEIFFEKIEKYILKKADKDVLLKSFTMEELINRIEESEQDFKNGRFKSQEDLEKISSNW
ncbi:MAG TPA: hypothetical protein VLY87_04085 [Flavobacterium sp.]|nr:hypothetical protein [Flavobacterium sp.]